MVLEQGSTLLRVKAGCQVAQGAVMMNWNIETSSHHPEGQVAYHTHVLVGKGDQRSAQSIRAEHTYRAPSSDFLTCQYNRR